jgi:RecB family endonuclease NucS
MVTPRSEIGKIARVPLREVWKHEAANFTTWLRDNIDVLNDQLDIALANPEIEQAAGAFAVDLVAEDASGNPVIIENQLEKTNHDHLGKLLTYLVSFEAKTAILDHLRSSS